MEVIWNTSPTRKEIKALISESKYHVSMGDFELQFDSDATFAITYRNEETILAGAIAIIASDWAYIESVWVDYKLRGQGIGRKLMAVTESYVASLGLQGIYLYTVDFQAPEFYAKLNYHQLGQLPNRPDGYNATYFYKTQLNEILIPDAFQIENPVTTHSFEVIEAGLIEHAKATQMIEAYEYLVTLTNETNHSIYGGIFAHEFWGYVDVHLAYADTTDNLQILLDELENRCQHQSLGIVIFASTNDHKQMLSQRGYDKLGELPNRPHGHTTIIWIRQQG